MAVISIMTVLAALFVASHIGLASVRVRSRLIALLGEWVFRWLYFGVAAATFTLATVYFAEHRLDGPAGPALGRFPILRWPLVAAIVLGIVFMVAAFSSYGRSPYALAAHGGSRDPRGLERVTRHPFFAGMALFATAHALLAAHLVASVLMLGLALLAVGGAIHQDRKLARLRGQGFAEYLAKTSALPFAAIFSGRQALVWREMPVLALAAGLALALPLSRIHDSIFAYHGMGVVAATVGGALLIALSDWRRERGAPRSPRAPHDLGAAPTR